MGIMDTVTAVVGLVQKYDNLELQSRALDLQKEVHALYDENRDLKDENRDLKERLARREQLTFKNNTYWIGEEGPYCSRCSDTDGKLVRLHLQKDRRPRCPSCYTIPPDPDEPPPRPVRRGSWLGT